MNEVKQHFESEALDFDRLILTLIPEYAQMLEALIAALPFESTMAIRAIDFGCGTGTVARALLDRFPNASVTCVDIAENMIAMAQSKLGHQAHVNYIVADFEAYKFEGTHDAVISSLALHHLLTDEDKQHFYRRIYEHLSPGGVFYNADVVLASNEFLQSVYLEKWITFMRREVPEEEIEHKWIPKYRAEDRPARLMDQLAWMVEIGFADIDIIWKRYNFAVYGGVRPG